MGTRMLYFPVQGSYITNIAREKLFHEKDLASAIRILRSSMINDELTSDEQLMMCLQVLHGAASIVGSSDSDDYGIEFREDYDDRPTDLSSISQLIIDMDEENKRLQNELRELSLRFIFLCSKLKGYELTNRNAEYYDETGKYLFSDIPVPDYLKKENQVANDMLKSFMEQRRREDAGEDTKSDYGWLEPNGTFHPVPWGEHSKFAQEWLKEHMPCGEYPDIYSMTDPNGARHPIVNEDVMIYSLGWILLHSPYRGLAKVTGHPEKEITTEQRNFLFDYYMERNRTEEANALYQEDK